MFETILSWIAIMYFLLGNGTVIALIIKKVFKCELKNFDAILVTGIAFCTVYAEIWSVLFPVNTISLLFVLIMATIIIIFGGAALTTVIPRDWDSYNYHAQSIRWITEYGVVKGLGNLHTRFAYNSAFLCLQALFSFHSFANKSMHSLNGLFWVFFTIWNIANIRFIREKRYIHQICFVLPFCLFYFDMILFIDYLLQIRIFYRLVYALIV